MARIISTFLTVSLLSLTSSVAHADSFGVTLRYWLATEDAPNSAVIRVSPSDCTVGCTARAYRFDSYNLEIPGLTLRWSPSAWENHDLLLSYYKRDRVRARQAIRVYQDDLNGELILEAESLVQSDPQSDMELLVRTRANENVVFYYGVRYIHSKFDQDASLLSPYPQTAVDNMYIAEAGLGLVSAFSENGRHSLFANAVIGAGRVYTEGTIDRSSFAGDIITYKVDYPLYTTDLNVGYQYTLNQRASFSLRYRDFSLSLDKGNSGPNGGGYKLARSLSGLDLGMTLSF